MHPSEYHGLSRSPLTGSVSPGKYFGPVERASKVALPLKELAFASQIPRLRTKANKCTEPEDGILGAMMSSKRLLGPLQMQLLWNAGLLDGMHAHCKS